MAQRTLHIALPVMGESANLPQFLSCIEKQTFRNFKIHICVNQYDDWWLDSDKRHYCTDNVKSLDYLSSFKNDIEIIDRSSKENGWPPKRGGVGWARKVLMDSISSNEKNDIIVSMDADTIYPEDYLFSINKYFDNHPNHLGLSLPYFHHLSRDETDVHILRYEIYMRYYALNMLRIKNPYNFTALGSALALPVWAYNKIGGMTPVKSGEDFYLLQKLVKSGPLGQWTDTTAYPSSRFSDRVLFGTGPALIKGTKGEWDSYPIYHPESFNLVNETFDLFPLLFKKDIDTPMSAFLKDQLKTTDLWGPLRSNYKDISNFVRACINKVDGLRILQFLRHQRNTQTKNNDESILTEYISMSFSGMIDNELNTALKSLNYRTSSINDMDLIRRFLQMQEMNLRKKTEDV